ncbi:MAG: chromosomal replication initiator protein DnaA, partial [Bacteroidetes bacterium]
MVIDHTSVWDRCLQNIRKNVNGRSFKTWFEPIKPVRLEDNSLTIQVPNRFFYEWLEEHYVSLLRTSIRQELGNKAKLEYQILTNKSSVSTTAAPSNNNSGQVTDSTYTPGMV